MAKKGQPAQLQIEVNNDEEWEKLLQKDGLIVVDVYSEWCGPCLGMQANLRKIKLEFGGDMLQLAIAKSDGITALERFKNKCEPTWMFISKGKMVALMFGADAPKLRKLIIEELTKEQAQLDGKPTDRTPMEVTELAEEERIRYDVLETKQREIREKEAAKKAKELLDRRTKECENILTNLPNYGTALIFPSAKDTYKGILHEILDEAGLNINQTEKKTIEDFGNSKICFALLFKRSNENLTGNIDDVVLQMVYGNAREPPGDEKSPAQNLKKIWQEGGILKNWEDVKKENDSEEENFNHIVLGIWAPPNSLCKATVLKLLFPNLSSPFRLVDLKIVPLHLALAYDAFKAKDIFELSEKYPGKVMSFGYFSSDMPGEAKLLGKTTDKFETRTVAVTYEEKLIIQLAKDDDIKCFTDFMDMGPCYVSSDIEIGELDCKFFFPSDYNTPEAEIITFMKKKSKRKGKFGKMKFQPDQLLEGDAQSAVTEPDNSVADFNGEQTGEDTMIGDDVNNEEVESEDEDEEGEKDENEEQNGETVESTDKATSPPAES